jgi:N6-adenosine-specific RNA methylase IME4
MAKRGIVKHVPLEPIRIGCYILTETGIEVEGEPTLSEHQGVGDFISRAHKASGWWVADWLRYGESRKDWKEKLDAVLDVTGYEYETAMNLKYLGENVPSSRRRADVDISKHFEVAPLPAKEQEQWLERTAEHGWTKRELRNEIRAAARVRVIQGQAHLEGMYRVILADPPWLYGDSDATADGSLGKAERHYPGMTIEALCNLPVKAHALENSILFCWVTAPMLYENPGPREVIEAWGFKPKTGRVWDKVLGNYGHYGHVTHEHLIIATRGSCLPDAPTPAPKSVFTIRRGEHSEKPEDARKTIMQQYTTGPYLELFGRKPVKGWSVFGNDPRLWAEQAKPPIDVKEEEVPF